jgi:hypothetical protein
MTDIVNRLREVAEIETGLLYSRRTMLKDASDEIERLRAERQRHAEVMEEVRKAALEEAAKIAERTGRNNEDDWPGETWIAEVIAKEIRALLSRLEER